MLDQNLWKNFELVRVETSRASSGMITISDNKKQMFISSRFMRELGWENGERVNLYKFGKTFAFKPDKVGLVTIHVPKKQKSGIITSINLCLEVLASTRSCRKFDGWVEDDVLFFKPAEGEV